MYCGEERGGLSSPIISHSKWKGPARRYLTEKWPGSIPFSLESVGSGGEADLALGMEAGKVMPARLRVKSCWAAIYTDNKYQISSYIREFRMEQLQRHITNGLLIYGEIFAHFLVCYFATTPLWISLYMRKIWFSFLSVYTVSSRSGDTCCTQPYLITKITKTGHFSILMYARWREPSLFSPHQNKEETLKYKVYAHVRGIPAIFVFINTVTAVSTWQS